MKNEMDKFKRILITWEGMISIPMIVFAVIFCAGAIQYISPTVAIFPEQYLQEIVYKTATLVIGSNVVQLGIMINLMLFLGFTLTDLKSWFQKSNDTAKLWVVVCFYALYYLVFALVRL